MKKDILIEAISDNIKKQNIKLSFDFDSNLTFIK